MKKNYKISIQECPVTRLDVEMTSDDSNLGIIDIKRVYDSDKQVERPTLIQVNEVEARSLVSALVFILHD